jgi:hypothetical protein
MANPVIPGGFVTCAKCEARYVLCPASDYYDATNDEDGLCESCVLDGRPVTVINPRMGERLQKAFESRRDS